MFRVDKRGLSAIVLALALTVSLPVISAAEEMDIDIPFEKFVLDNGLTVIVHEDHKAPIVAVNVWYHVGSKNEKPGRTGFAHLFEHLMFNGSENFDDDYFQAMAGIGATDLNGTTNEDRTNYFQNVPTTALDTLLWMESDRMGHLLGAVTQEKLDEQRGVVQNEKRQGENQPYAVSRQILSGQSYPDGHPYSWTVIGSMADLDAAALDDVHQWFKDYYGAANATIVLAGDIDVETARKKVEKYFGNISSGPPVNRPQVNIAKRAGSKRFVAQDRVPNPRIYKVWNVPEWGSTEHDQLELAASVLSSGKTSRLYRRLVYEDQIAQNAFAYVSSGELGSQFTIVATAQSGVEFSRVEKAVEEELERFLREGPTEDELRRVKTEFFAGFIRGSERIGGFGGKSDILAMNQVYGGSPDFYKTTHANLRAATPEDVQRTANRWLSDGLLSLEIHPFPEYGVAAKDADRSAVPVAGTPPRARFPELERARLSNGLEIILAERNATPVVSFNLLINAGYAADQFTGPGTARLAMDMLDEGTTKRSALEINDQLALLGATLGAGSNLDQSTVSMSALTANLDGSLDLFADVVMNPAFPQREFDRRQKQQVSAIQNEKVQPFNMALRVFPGLLYGKDHPYGLPFTGSGTEESVNKMTRKDLVEFHETWFKPNNATLVVVGDTSMKEIKPKLEGLFKSWKSGKTPKKDIREVAMSKTDAVYLVDKPGAMQSIIIAGHVAPPRGEADQDVAQETMNTILGGTFISRLNMNLREDKHWSYGARTLIIDAQGQRPFLAYAPVQTDKTKESLVEVLREMQGIRGDRPITLDELDKIKSKKVLELPGSWETNAAVSGSIVEMVRFGLADDYFNEYPKYVTSLSVDDVAGAAVATVHPGNLVWVVVGDREKIEAGIRELELGEIHHMDADGNLVK